MKAKYLFIAVAVASLFSACNRDEKSLFDQSAAERSQLALDNAQKMLVAHDSWEMLYFANRESRGYNVVVKFFSNGKVIAAAQNALTTNNQLLTDSSTWVLRNDYGPIISFDTYNKVLHAWADPQEDGDGYLGDYEFLILEANANRIMLKGKKHSAYIILRPMPKMEIADYFKTCNSQLSKYFGNDAIMTLYQGGSAYYLHNGASGIFTLTAVGQPVPEVDPIIYPICPTLDGFVVCYAFNSTLYMDRGVAMEHLFTLTGDKFVGEGGSIISSGDLSTYFYDFIHLAQGSWVFDLSNMCSSVQNAYDAADAEIKTKYSNPKKGGIKDLRIQVKENSQRAVMAFSYIGSGTKATAYYYCYQIEKIGGAIKLNYTEPWDDNAAKVIAAIPAIETLLKSVNGVYNLSADNPINPTNGLTLVDKSDAGLWIKVTGTAE